MVRFFGKNEIILGIVSILSIVGFIITVIVAIRTNRITKILKLNQVTNQYNRERTALQKAFVGHRESILNDGIRTDDLLKKILQNVTEYREKFSTIMSLRERITIRRLVRLLKKESNKVDYNSVCNCLATIAGRLSKKEEKRNG